MSAVTVKPRDVILTFNDSCNCCTTCFCHCEPESPREADTELYVNKTGNLEIFNPDKAKDKVNDTSVRTLVHLSNGLDKRVKKFGGDPVVFRFKASKILDDISKNKKLTVLNISEINNLMLMYFTEKTSPAEHKGK